MLKKKLNNQTLYTSPSVEYLRISVPLNLLQSLSVEGDVEQPITGQFGDGGDGADVFFNEN